MKRVLVVGSSVVDLCFYSERIPAVGETITGRFQQGLGGKGFNQAIASARASAPTSFLSALGCDSYAPLFRERLKELGVEQDVEEIPEAATGAAAISIDKQGRNNIIVALGANEKMSARFLESRKAFFEKAGIVLLQFETNLEIVDCALTLAKKCGAITILNPAPGIANLSPALLRKVDFLTPNETELAIVSGCAANTDAEIEAASAAIQGPGAILATLAEKGSMLWRAGDAARFPAFRVNTIDTTGAGDAFNGGFAAGLLEHSNDLPKAIRFATALAALSTTKPGTSASMPSRPEIEQFLGQSR
jgi:ribokinase